MPRLADKRVDEIDTADVMAVLLPIWSTKRVTAKRVRQRIAAVMKWAVAQGYRQDNPAGDAISAALPKNAVPQQHQRALPHAKVGRGAGPGTPGRGHTGAPSSPSSSSCSPPAATARCAEPDGKRSIPPEAVWTIPAERMKAAREHRVPLSPPCARSPRRRRSSSQIKCGLVFPVSHREGF